MEFGFSFLSVVAVREHASDSSQMVSQLLFGDVVEVLDRPSKNWALIRNAYDKYEGYVDPKHLLLTDSVDFLEFQTEVLYNRKSVLLQTSFGDYQVPAGCTIPSKKFRVGDFHCKCDEELFVQGKKKADLIPEIAKRFLNTPYLWGGKTAYGTDCSGFTQTVFKMAGIALKRDASQQVTQGEALSFLVEAEAGDLAFFDNEEGNITHVGILLSSNEIIHASGRVRIDKIDHQGIYNEETGEYTHQLRVLKRMV